MLRRSSILRQTHDPMFIRRIKKTYSRYAAAMEETRSAGVSKEAFVDIDEKGPAWYLGHMARTKRVLQSKLDDIDFFIEMRDARLPFTTENPHITELSGQRPRIIVFNKADLSNEEMNRLIHRHFEDEGHYTLFTAASRTWKDTVEAIQKFVVHVLPQKEFKLTAHAGCIVGMPNVGKSTLINSLRMAHEFQFHREDFRRPKGGEEVSMSPGTTRQVKLVPMSRDPNIVLHDTPGLTLPGTVHKEAGLKLAACGILPTNNMTLTDASVARYIYECMAAAGANEHLAECLHLSRAPVSFEDCSIMLCERSGKSAQSLMGSLEYSVAHSFIINDFMAGKLGRITLDKIPRKMLPNIGAARPNTNNNRNSSSSWEQQQQKSSSDDKEGQQQNGSSDTHFVMEHEVESYDVSYSTASSFNNNTNNNNTSTTTGSGSSNDKTKNNNSQTSGGDQQDNSSSSSFEQHHQYQREADPLYVHSAMTRLHAAPDHTDHSVISRKKGPLSRDSVLAGMNEHTILRNQHRIKKQAEKFDNKTNSSNSKRKQQQQQMMNKRGKLSGSNLSQLLQKKV